MSRCTCTTDKEITCIVHPTDRSMKASNDGGRTMFKAFGTVFGALLGLLAFIIFLGVLGAMVP